MLLLPCVEVSWSNRRHKHDGVGPCELAQNVPVLDGRPVTEPIRCEVGVKAVEFCLHQILIFASIRCQKNTTSITLYFEDLQINYKSSSSKPNLNNLVSVLSFDEKAEKNSVQLSSTHAEISGSEKAFFTAKKYKPIRNINFH